jgi:retron-type reverse transcriptase
MKTYNKLYEKLYSIENLISAFKKARKGKSKKDYVISFESNLNRNLKLLQKELKSKTYKPCQLKKFVIRDPKTRTIHKSLFRDRIVHHAIINIIQPIYEKRFIYDSFASRKSKGSHVAVKRFEYFVRKVSSNGQTINKSFNNNSIKGYCFKADIKHYFNTINHKVLLDILRKNIKDKDLIGLIKIVLDNFETPEGKGLPLGNYTSQFFANVYLNQLDYFIKHRLKAKYYIRYVDDFVILDKDKKKLKEYWNKINKYIIYLKLELHPDKSEIHALRNGITFLGYRIFYHYKLLKKRNINYFYKRFNKKLNLYREGLIEKEDLESFLQGWKGYSKFANTHNFNKKIKIDS